MQNLNRVISIVKYSQRTGLNLIFAILILFSIQCKLFSAKPKMVVLTDISETEPDDKQTLIRLMVYANELDILGLINNSSVHGQDRIHPDITKEIVEAYGQVRSNLLQHDTGYPTYAYLESIIKAGQTTYGMSGVGSGKDSAGSEFIINILDNNSGPIWFQGWGGLNTLAQALWKLKNTRDTSEVNSLAAKIKIYDIAGQDDAGAWIAHNFPNIVYLRSCEQFIGISVSVWDDAQRGGDESCITKDWYSANIQNNHGALGSQYPDHKWIVEGDTPAFLFIINNGLNPSHIPNYGSWGGRFTQYEQKNLLGHSRLENSESPYEDWYMNLGDEDDWTSGAPDYYAGLNSPYYNNLYASIFRWRRHFQNDFAARMDWCVKSYSQANHPPVANIDGGLARTVNKGSDVTLSADGSSDPDGNDISYNWYYYKSAGSCSANISINNYTGKYASFTVPATASIGDKIHIILTVKDNGSPWLVRYKRLIVTVGDSSHIPPTVVISEPASGTTFDSGSDIEFTADASDSDGSIDHVEFYVDGSLVQTENIAPYNYIMGNAITGNYAITARAIDSDGLETISSTVNITVGALSSNEITVISVTAGSEETENPINYIYDNSLTTRWGSSGIIDESWIMFDLGSTKAVEKLELLLFKGESRTYPIKIEIGDGTSFVTAWSGETTISNSYFSKSFGAIDGRYVKVSLTGNNSENNGWLSIYDAAIYGVDGTENGLVIASSSESAANSPEKSIDQDTTTRWSSAGEQWIRYDLEAVKSISSVSLSFWKGYERIYDFDIQLSTDDNSYTTISSDSNSGTTEAPELFNFTATDARYIKILCHGNSVNEWNNIIEFSYNGQSSDNGEINIMSAVASISEPDNPAGNAIDDDLTTRWSAEGVGETLTLDLGSEKNFSSLAIVWFNGSERSSYFEIELSNDNSNWQTILTNGESSGTTSGFENISLGAQRARYIRITGNGNSANDWNSILEIKVYGSGITIDNATASSYETGNPPANVIDGDLTTRWSVEGIGETLTLDLGSISDFSSLAIAWFNGSVRSSYFEIELSSDNSNWQTILTNGESSGTTSGFENISLGAQTARYIRITGDGNSVNDWNSILEINVN